MLWKQHFLYICKLFLVKKFPCEKCNNLFCVKVLCL